MDMLVYRLNMCVDLEDYEQRLEIYKEIQEIAERNIRYYEYMIKERDQEEGE